MKKYSTFITLAILAAFIAVCIAIYYYLNRVETPIVGPNGDISGSYTVAGILSLKKPYVCTFSKTDRTSKIEGTLKTDGNRVYEQFRIKTDLLPQEFNSFLLIRDNTAYTWTSLQNIGYKSVVAKSASINASPQEQAQIIGTRDKIKYDCKPWENIDSTIFEIPTWINFSGINK